MGYLGSLSLNKAHHVAASSSGGGVMAPASGGGVMNAISKASAKTGVDFDYLVKQAKVESGLNPKAKASTSSASGLYQFIDQTWLRMVKTYGAEHGYGDAAEAISQRGDGSFTVAGNARKSVLSLKNDAQAASLMAAEFASENADYLRTNAGIENPTQTDLYMAHFLGAGGASTFMRGMQKNPYASAASIFPEAARANRNIFFEKSGQPRSLAQVYDRFAAKFGDDQSSSVQIARNNAVSSTADADTDVMASLVRVQSANIKTAYYGNAPSQYGWLDTNYTANITKNNVGAVGAAGNNAVSDIMSNLGSLVRAPMDALMMAQEAKSRFFGSHDETGRYNS